MRLIERTLSAVALLAIVGCVSSLDVRQSVSIDQLLENPSQFDQKIVVLLAYARIQFEGNRLCAVPGAPNKRCISLVYDDGPYETEKDMARFKAAMEKWRAFDGKYLLVRGTFSRGPSGHFGLSPGEIYRITGVEIAP
jgi:hypothetical protein